jgi:ATP-dependent protease HslVU (ClpYQ) peptidase subunit
VELAKAWRMDKFLRRLDVRSLRTQRSARCASSVHAAERAAMRSVSRCPFQAVMVVADETHSLQITGNGDVLEPHDGIIGAHL